MTVSLVCRRRNSEAEAPAPVEQRKCRPDYSYCISNAERKNFWENDRKEEEARRCAEKARLAEVRRTQEDDARRLEAELASASEDADCQRPTGLIIEKRADTHSEHSQREEERRRWDREQAEAAFEEEERRRWAESLRKARVQEAQKLGQSRRDRNAQSDTTAIQGSIEKSPDIRQVRWTNFSPIPVTRIWDLNIQMCYILPRTRVVQTKGHCNDCALRHVFAQCTSLSFIPFRANTCLALASFSISLLLPV